MSDSLTAFHRSQPRSRVYAALALFTLASITGLFAQEASPAKTIELEKFVATGSRFNDRTVTQSPVPIDVVSGTELKQGGYNETSQMLQANIPSFNFPRPSLTDGTDHIRPATLRGLAPDETLVLINGKRRHTSALVNLNGSIGRGSVSTDFNAIPAAMIERIEVLRDGASAQYGSDAIAGVINVILRKDLGWGLTLGYGQTGEGDGEDYKLDAFAGAKFGEKGSIFVDVYLRDHGATNRSLPDTRQQYFGTSTTTGLPTTISANYGSGTGLSPSNGTLDPREVTVRRLNHRFGDPKTKDKGFWLNASYPLEDGSELYFFGGNSIRHANGAGFYRRAGQDNNVRAIYGDGFLPFIDTKVNDLSGGIGIKAQTGEWNYDLSTNYGTNALDYRTSNSVNVSLGAASGKAFYDGQLKFNQWTTNLDLTTHFRTALATPLKFATGAEYRTEKYTIKAGDPDSYRNGGITILDGPNAGGLAALGAQVFPGFKPTDAGSHTRNAKSVYVDFEQNLTDKWLVDLAGRFEDYSDFGRDSTVKFATRVELPADFALRGSVSTGFRSPHLAQEWFSSTATNFIGGIPFDILTFPVNAPAAVAFGAKPLKPEKSTSYSGGFTWNPKSSGFSGSVDFYNIKIKDRIVLSSNFINNNGTNVTTFLASQGITGIGGGRYFTNAVDTTTTGVDVSGRYVWKTSAAGKWTFTAGYNHNTTKADRVSTPPAALAAITTTPLLDLTEVTRLVKGQPRDNVNLSAGWEIGKFSILAREVRYGEVSLVAFSSATQAQIDALTPGYNVSFAPAVPGAVGGTTANRQIIQTFSAKFLTDLDVTYHYNKNIMLSVGANNLFDVYPDENIRSKVVNGAAFNGSDNAGIFPYNSVSPFGFNGVFYYTKLSLKF
ncbi:MAG: TonB-dependent receptor [bacterium]|nr:TonB-dependent receptor [bacterium]MDI1337326.1 TonB-dependent receptor [Lacunisphaera sp.]